MNVFTTATDASAMPVAAGTPSSRTSPDDWRVNRPWPEVALPAIGVLVLAMLPSPKSDRERRKPTRVQRSRTICQPPNPPKFTASNRDFPENTTPGRRREPIFRKIRPPTRRASAADLSHGDPPPLPPPHI